MVVKLAKRYYEQDDSRVLPRAIATFEAFENAMSLDIAMGGSTNTVLHLLAAAHEAGVDFTMADIDRLSRKVPNLCKVAPATREYHMEDVHRAGGVIGILGELAGVVCCMQACRPCTARPRAMPSSTGTYGTATRRKPEAATWPVPAVFPPRLPSARIVAGLILTWTGKAAVSATLNMPTVVMAVWRCCSATWPKTGVS